MPPTIVLGLTMYYLSPIPRKGTLINRRFRSYMATFLGVDYRDRNFNLLNNLLTKYLEILHLNILTAAGN